MLGIFVKSSWHSTLLTDKYEYSTQIIFFCKIKVCEKVQTVTPVDANLLHSTINRSPACMVSLFITHVRLILDYC